MQSSQARGARGPVSPPSYQGSDRQWGAPYLSSHGNEENIPPTIASSTRRPTFDPYSSKPCASMEEPAVHDGTYNQIQRPMFGATTPLPNVSFPHASQFHAFGNASWPADTQGSLQPAPPVPHVNPRFLNRTMGNTPPAPFPMVPFNPLVQFQNTQPMSTFAGPPATQEPRRQRHATPPVKQPVPTEAYVQQASQAPKMRSHPQPLLIILDLNGTLIFRKRKKLPPSFARRAGLDHFLDELTRKYAVMIWSSSKPATVDAVCQQLFPEDKKRNIVGMWGRDKFDLTNVQYNAKLQVYKELRKVWADPNIQAAHPRSKPVSTKRPGGRFSKRNERRRQNNSNESPQSPPVGQRWDQTNTILIDDSKIKALSEPYNILEIPEFTGNPSTDESTLFANVLHKLDTLSHYDDVSKVLRLVNELAEKEGKPVLDMEFPTSEGGIPFSEEDVSDGGVKLAPPTKPKGNGEKSATAQQAQTRSNTAEGIEIAQLNKAAKKARKQAKKEAKKAAQAGQTAQKPPAGKAASTGQPGITASKSSVTETTASNAAMPTPATDSDGSVKRKRGGRRRRNQAARRAAQDLAQQSAPAAETGKRYNLRARTWSNVISVTEGNVDSTTAFESIDTRVGLESFAPEGDPLPPLQPGGGHQRNRSPSSASANSDSSRNSLLDRLEEGLGIHRH